MPIFDTFTIARYNYLNDLFKNIKYLAINALHSHVAGIFGAV